MFVNQLMCSNFLIVNFKIVASRKPMISNIESNQQNFVYIDSSQEEDNHYKQNGHLQEFTHSDIAYHDSSSSDLSFCDDNVEQNPANLQKPNHHKAKKLCKINSDKFLLNDGYMRAVENIIKENQQKLVKKTPLLIANTDKEILQNLEKRKKNYGFFLRTLQTDKNYNQILSNKVSKLKQQNQRKKQVLQKKRLKQTVQQDQKEMKKYVLDKKLKQEIVIDKIQKHAYKLGIERIRAQEKKTKSELKQIDEINNIKTINLDIKQRNQIYELREQLQKMKEINRVNKLEQKKVLKDLQKNVTHSKLTLISKAQTAQLNKFII